MNYLAIDYGTKRIGLAISTSGIISTISPIANNKESFSVLIKICQNHQIDKVFVGISEGDFAKQTQDFVAQLKDVLKLPIEEIEEAVSTIEAQQLFQQLHKKKKNYKKEIDSISAAIILRRALTN